MGNRSGGGGGGGTILVWIGTVYYMLLLQCICMATYDMKLSRPISTIQLCNFLTLTHVFSLPSPHIT